jgi:hypothetical protein
MGMGEKKVYRAFVRSEQLVPELSQARAGVDDNDIVVLGPDLDAGRVAAIVQVLFPGNGY